MFFEFSHYTIPFSLALSFGSQMDQMEGTDSPRFRKLHFPVGLWINSPRKHFAKLGGRWPSAISVKSVSLLPMYSTSMSLSPMLILNDFVLVQP